jgi:alkylation response protein AidB-like acyl-CoA dehydrogenase
MGNFLKDNEDLQFYLNQWLDWDKILEVVEPAGFGPNKGYASKEEALETFSDILEMLGGFAADEIAPKSLILDQEGVTFENGTATLGPTMNQIFDQMKELEVHGLLIPRELGGMGCPMVVYNLAAEIIARADVCTMTHFGFHGGIAMVLLMYSMHEGSTSVDTETMEITETRFRDAISEIIAGDAWGSMDITEPDAGSDMAAMRSVGEQDENGDWLVTGNKIFITSGHGKYHVVIARTEPVGAPDDPFAGLKGLSLFLVPLFEDEEDGTRTWHGQIDRIEEKMGHHACATCSITYDRSPGLLLGERGDGFKLMLMLMNNARISVACESLGICEAAYRLARDYAAERPSMGKTIDRHEMIADMLEEMETDICGIRALTYACAEHEEISRRMKILRAAQERAGAPTDAEAVRVERRHSRKSRRYTPMAKYLASEKACEMARRAIQILGGVGYIKEYGAEKLLRDALVFPIYEGTSQIQALMVMKDTLTRILKRPADLVSRRAQTRWTAMSARDPLERGVARIQGLALAAQQRLLMRTAARKFKGMRAIPITQWKDAMDGWDPKRDFAPAMLHAERLTRLLADEAICELLWKQAEKHPERRPILERYLERAEPRCRFLLDEISNSGDRLINQLRDLEGESDQEVA